jgi:phosphopantothenoylcysteine decarboxylase/phosphopantothenate--cysteine ligase
MAAAPADYRPAEYAPEKIRRDGEHSLALVATPDIAAELGAAKPASRVLVVFAAETAAGPEAEETARAKLARKRADLVVLNRVGGAGGWPDPFGGDTNAAVVLGADGSRTLIPELSKDDVADAIWDLVAARLSGTGQPAVERT